jgi:perosamine synthetase
MSERLVEPTAAPEEPAALPTLVAESAPRLPVRLQPVLPVGRALGLGAPSGRLPFPLDQPRAFPTFSGTAAIYQAFRAMRLAPGSVVLCPSYNCGHEIEPLIRLGLRVRCYRVGAAMEADLDDLRHRMSEEVKAVLVTHFFGFAQPVDDVRVLCDRWGALLVEDCAHALLGDNAGGTLGRVGDVSVFSLRKTLPLPNGGAALFNNSSLSGPQDLEAPPSLTTWLKSVSLAKKSALDAARHERSWGSIALLAAMAPVAAANGAVRRIWPSRWPAGYDPDDEDYGFASRILGWGMAPYSMAVLQRTEWRTIAARRRGNYRFLAERLSELRGCRLIHREVPARVCPLFLPLVVDDRGRLFSALARHGINSAVWWDDRHPAVAWDEFPEAADLKARVLALPVHQDLTTSQLEYVVSVLSRSLPTL